MRSRQQAVRNTRLAQAGVLALAAALIGLFLAPTSAILAPTAKPIEPTPILSPADQTPTLGTDEIARISQIFAASNPRVEKPRVETPVDTAPPDQATSSTPAPDTAPEPPAGEWAYLGSMVSPNRTYALMRADDGQFMIAKGGIREHRELTEIHPDHVIFVDRSHGPEATPVSIRFDLLPPTAKWPETGPGRMATPPPTARASGSKVGLSRSGSHPTAPRAVHPPARPTPGTPIVPSLQADIGSVETLVSQISSGSFSPNTMRDTFEKMGLSPEAPFDDQVDFFRNAGVDPEHAPEFIKGLIQFNRLANPGFEADHATQKYLNDNPQPGAEENQEPTE